MKEWTDFLWGNKRLLNFGFQFNFFSAFGQTFFVSLYVPHWVEAMGVSNGFIGSAYASATLAAAVLLTLTGKYIDTTPLPGFARWVAIGLVLSVTLLALAPNIYLLVPALLLVRWLGQGMMVHTATTSMALLFDADRGKALGMTALGHPAGQFVLPLVVTTLIAATGWRLSLGYLALFGVVVLGLSIGSLGKLSLLDREYASRQEKRTGKPTQGRSVFREWTFWGIVFNTFAIPFFTTAIFLYQYILGQERGWDTAWIAFSFGFFAVFNALGLIVSGGLVDRFSGKALFVPYLLPALAGFLVLALAEGKWSFPVFYALTGISAGLAGTVKMAVLAEVYGVGEIGKIRSYFTTLLVVSTAVGPPAFGVLIDRGANFQMIMLASSLLLAVILMVSMGVSRKLQTLPRM